jgi:predicted nuclease of predicted toxin-antitoxin system
VKNIRLLADVHISPKTVADLQKQGYEIMRSSEFLPANAPDINILEFARTENWVVLTQDLDFSMLVALSRYSQPSLITLRLSSAKPDIVTQKLLNVLPQIEEALQEGSAITIQDDSIRIRKLPVRSGLH